MEILVSDIWVEISTHLSLYEALKINILSHKYHKLYCSHLSILYTCRPQYSIEINNRLNIISAKYSYLHYDLSNQDHLSDSGLENMKSVQTFIFNHAENITNISILNMPNLTKLNLEWSYPFYAIDDDVFSNLTNLKSLQLNTKIIQTITYGLDHPLHNSDNILKGNKLTSLDLSEKYKK